MLYSDLSLLWRFGGVVAIVGAAACGAGFAQGPLMMAGTFSVSDVIRDRDAVVGRRITVLGRVRAVLRPGDEQSRGVDSFAATLHLVDSTHSAGAIIDIFRATRAGEFEPLTCQVSNGVVRCGEYIPDAITAIAGTWRKEQVPSGQIVHPDGRIEPRGWRVVYFLLVD